MKDFSRFLKEEISIKGNIGIPGEGDDKDEKKYLSDVELRARQRLGVPREEDPRQGPPMQTMQTAQQLMGLVSQSMRYVRGKEAQLEELAKKVILSHYESILSNVDLDIKLVTGQQIANFMDEECEDCEMPSYQLLNDPEIKKEVDKRKILNNIMQGEGKNTKRIMAMPEVLDGLIDIYGERDARIIHDIWMKTVELADKLDWLIPVEAKGQMMEEAPQYAGGACSVKWPGLDKAKEDLSDKVLKDLEQGDINDDNEDLQELLSTGNPVIKARGVDFPMLLHETVKGIYELIAASGIPEDKRTAELVILNTSSFADEAEEFRYGPEIAADIRDFINKSTKDIDKYPNIRERFCGRLSVMPADDFLLLVKNILSDSPSARTKVDEIIQEIIDEMDTYNKALAEYEAGVKLGEIESGEEVEEPETKEEPSVEKEEEVDYSKMSQRQIQSMIDDALDAGDYNKVKTLSQYLKEGKEIYLREIERINEGHVFHTRRNNI